MDNFGISRTTIRSQILNRLTGFTAKATGSSDYARLTKALDTDGQLFSVQKANQVDGHGKDNGTRNGDGHIYEIPIPTKELEVLLALSSSVPYLKDAVRAGCLLDQLGLYLLDSYRQHFSPSAIIRDMLPSPWEILTYKLVLAIVDIGQKFESLDDQAGKYLSLYIDGVSKETIASPGPYSFGTIFPLSFSLQGFLSAISDRAHNFKSTESQYNLISSIAALFSSNFPLQLEESVSSLRTSGDNTGTNRVWNSYRSKYRSSGKSVGSVALRLHFIETLRHVAGLYVIPMSRDAPPKSDIDYKSNRSSFLDDLMEGARMRSTLDEAHSKSLQLCRDIALSELANVDDGAEYLDIMSTRQRRMSLAVKASALEILCIAVLSGLYDLEKLMQTIENTLASDEQIMDEQLIATVFKIMALLCRSDSDIGASLTRIFPRLIVRYNASKETIQIGTICVAYALKSLSEDAVISTLYTLSNIIVGLPDRKQGTGLTNVSSRNLERVPSMGSDISLLSANDDERNIIFENVIHALARIVEKYKDNKITALAISVLMQKIGRVNGFIDRCIVVALSVLSLHGVERDLRTVLKLYSRLCVEAVLNQDVGMMDAILDARTRISKKLQRKDQFYDLYLKDMLDSIVSKGDVYELEHHRPHQDITNTAKEISLLIRPLASLLPPVGTPAYTTDDHAILSAFRNAWFNIVVHGYSRDSEWAKAYRSEFEVIAWNSPPLISESSSNRFESDMEINTVLRRGSSHHNLNDQRQQILSAFTSTPLEVRTLPYPKLIFLSTALFLESLRASAGDCSKVILYFVDPSLKSGDTHKFMLGITNEVLGIYLNKVQGKSSAETSEIISKQLRQLLITCCHRIKSVSTVAISCTQRFIATIPSALCNRKSLFTLLELLTLLWNSCLDEDVDQYSPRSVFISTKADITLELSDSYAHRKATLKLLHDKATLWVQTAIDNTPLDMKGLLQTYLAEMDDFRAFGHVAFGRSFAVEMGGRIALSDNKLASIGRQADVGADTVSDFLAQYTWRQVYRKVEPSGGALSEEDEFLEVKKSLDGLKEKVTSKKFISIAELREGLLRATAYSLKNAKLSAPLMHYIAFIPLSLFTKQSIKLGVSLWLWIVNEEPKLQSRILAEIALGFEWSIRNHEGIFSRVHDIIPVLDGKMEYAPSSKDEITHDARIAANSFAPHLYIVDMLSSHFQSSRFQSPHLFEIFERTLRVALLNMEYASYHPLVRENRFNIILFSLRILEGHNGLSSQRTTYFKHLTLTAALTWFSKPAIYPFGGDRLHLKSEFRLLLEVYQLVKNITVKGLEKNLLLDVKQELLLQFLESEVYAMSIWLEPLQFIPYRQLKTIIPKNSFEPTPQMAIVAWQIDPPLAVYYAKRFKNKDIDAQLKQLILADTSKIVHIADALEYLLDGEKDSDPRVSELKYLLFWERTSPVDAINLFMPAHSKNPLVLQYAMRSLESHNIDVTFFYVPQIVQMLRHDESGYIEQFILETGKLDQLFAHQIIWNMQANSYRDEDEKIPDPLKPTLDRIMDTLIGSFAGEDRQFYDREFEFFREVTSISGKLKPYIKKTKAEKKIKIDEEMRKIKVDVGVYLPSNPDGTVIGIDRKSGRPLQSHAKAPFMATFKIRKNVKTINTVRIDGEDDSENTAVETVEKMLSAIFKVGDDCRQDMLALQLIALFRSIFSTSGLDLYLFPYRVIATAPGCGIIDALPNSISRDMLGREAVNGLYEYFISKHGSEDSIKFQQARNGFVQSMAAYSVVSYLLQFKDRHNGNIMYDDQGHILHIDFGFCFDIVPGGVKFEAAPFKLTSEMVKVMGGSSETQAYHWFEELCIKAFLASRPYAESIIKCVSPMLESGLPCFKGETTIRKLRDRFVLEKSDKDAAVFMRGLIRKSAESLYTRGYDEFQRVTNGIPY